MTPSNFLIRGLLAGLLAGLAAFTVAYTVGEPQVDTAIGLEEAHAAAHPEPEPAETHEHMTEVSRGNQSTWGLLTGTLSIGIALGGVASLAAAFALGRIGRLKPGQTTALVAAIGFVAFELVPFLKYPATPPAVGNPDTIGQRTTLYFTMLAISVVAAILSTILASRLLKQGKSGYVATVIPVVAFVAGTALAAGLLPTVNEVGQFPADTLWFFRRASLLTTAALWTVLGVALTGFIRRLHARETAEAARRELAASL